MRSFLDQFGPAVRAALLVGVHDVALVQAVRAHCPGARVHCLVSHDQDGFEYAALDIRHGQPHRLPWAADTFDAIVWDASVSMASLTAALPELHRVLTAEGRLLMTGPVGEPLTPHLWERLLGEAGFTVERAPVADPRHPVAPRETGWFVLRRSGDVPSRQVDGLVKWARFLERRADEREAVLKTRVAELERRLAEMETSVWWRLGLLPRLASTVVRDPDRALAGRAGQALLSTYRRLPVPQAWKSNLRSTVRRRVFGLPPRPRLTESPPDREVPWQHADGLPPQLCDDVFVWGLTDWNFRTQRPQHLARGLAARGHRVFFISAAFIDADEPGFTAQVLDADGRLVVLRLRVTGAPQIFSGAARPHVADQIRAAVAQVLAWTGSRQVVSLVEHAYWLPFAEILPNGRLVYDLMDHHQGFGNMPPELIASERRLFAQSDLVVVTSGWLDRIARSFNDHVAVLPNGGDYERFATRPADVFRDPAGRRIIGYYGAIADWFDVDLVRAVAAAFPDALVQLIGWDTVNAQRALRDLPNVGFVPEVPYESLPFYLWGFDVCLLPFKVSPLTLATSPVKVYEYLSAGKPVVSVALPELASFDGHVAVADGTTAFVAAVGQALAEPADSPVRAARAKFASAQTWSHRTAALETAIARIAEPLVSIVVVTYNNLPLTRACLESIERFSDYGALEVVVVDNASTDGTPEFLQAWAGSGAGRVVQLNAVNRGFAAGSNYGLRLARGEYLVLLNNDTIVTPGWVRTLTRHLRRDPTIGLIGPVTNDIGNEARVPVNYHDVDEMQRVARRHALAHLGGTYPLRTAAFFCVMMPRAVYERVGPLDEAFGLGLFEDDDYSRRVEQAGWRIVCADDVFIHHDSSAAFRLLGAEQREALFEANRRIYEEKWGTWTPHRHREST